MVAYLSRRVLQLAHRARRRRSDLHDEVLAHLELLKERGPLLARPYADTLKGSKFTNMKELRFSHSGAPIRILFAFDHKKRGVIILGGDKTGDKRWYDKSIPKADKLYGEHIEKEKKKDEEQARLRGEKTKTEKPN